MNNSCRFLQGSRCASNFCETDIRGLFKYIINNGSIPNRVKETNESMMVLKNMVKTLNSNTHSSHIDVGTCCSFKSLISTHAKSSTSNPPHPSRFTLSAISKSPSSLSHLLDYLSDFDSNTELMSNSDFDNDFFSKQYGRKLFLV